jgi:branched-subunit amino acid aminotransferase/4-amino-4-deoxychorismate lyase
MKDDTLDVVAVNGVVGRRSELRLADYWTGFSFGAGFFETILVRRGTPMFLEEHLARLRASLQAHGEAVLLPPPEVMTTSAVASTVDACLEQGPGASFTGALKLTVSDGRLLVTFRAYSPQPRRIELPRIDRETYRRGDRSLNHKSTSHLRQYRSMNDLCVYVNEGDELCETPIGNLFFLRDGRIVTPRLDAPCLPGIVRGVLLKAGSCAGIPIVEEHVSCSDLARVTGCAMTNSLQLASPVDSILGFPMPESGPLANALRERIFPGIRGLVSDISAFAC